MLPRSLCCCRVSKMKSDGDYDMMMDTKVSMNPERILKKPPRPESDHRDYMMNERRKHTMPDCTSFQDHVGLFHDFGSIVFPVQPWSVVACLTKADALLDKSACKTNNRQLHSRSYPYLAYWSALITLRRVKSVASNNTNTTRSKDNHLDFTFTACPIDSRYVRT